MKKNYKKAFDVLLRSTSLWKDRTDPEKREIFKTLNEEANFNYCLKDYKTEMKKQVNDLSEEVLNYLGNLEFKHGEEPHNIELELNKFGWSLEDKESIGLYNDLRGYMEDEINPFIED